MSTLKNWVTPARRVLVIPDAYRGSIAPARSGLPERGASLEPAALGGGAELHDVIEKGSLNKGFVVRTLDASSRDGDRPLYPTFRWYVPDEYSCLYA
jgi:hypothetical protein